MTSNRDSESPSGPAKSDGQDRDEPFDRAKLRRIAEGRAALKPLALPTRSGDLQALLHELQVHQIELEMQNEALQDRVKIEAQLTRYTDLYELAPSACFTLDRRGTIRQFNRAGAAMIGHSPLRLNGQRMGTFVTPACVRVLNDFLERAFGGPDRQTCELTIQRDYQPDIIASFEGIVDQESDVCRVVASDITAQKRAEQALRESEERLRLVLLGANDGWWDRLLTTDRLYFSPRWLSMLGYAAGELTADVGLLVRLMHPDDRERVEKAWREALAGKVENYELEFRLRHKDGHFVPVLSRAHITRDARGRAIRVSGTDTDLTVRKLADQERRLAQMVFSSTVEGILVTDAAGIILEVNPAFEDITGYAREEVVGQDVRMLQSDTQGEAFWESLWQALAEGGSWRGELWKRRKSGEAYPEWLTVSAVRDEQGHPTHYVGVFSDISTAKAAQEQIEFLAYHDALTRLPNKALLRERLEHALVRARRRTGHVAVLVVDIDRFKHVNDALGHTLGDALLQEVGRRMAGVLRAEDTLARLGGDEFVLLLEDETTSARAESVARKLLSVLSSPLAVGEHVLRVTVSIGASLYPEHGDDADTLLRHADHAMYQAKKLGRNRLEMFESHLSAEAMQRFFMENALRSAVDEDQLVLHLQPQIDLVRHRIAGMEALVRWRHPRMGLLQPAQFIPLAEEIDVIKRIDHWVLNEACRQIAQWSAEGIDIPYVAVNLSAHQLESDHLVESVADALRTAGLRPHRLELELTESMVMHHPEEACAVLGELRRLGVKTAVDDFGTGYSSLAYLKRLPVHRLKIDKSFVHDIGRDSGDEAITRAVIRLAGSLGLETIAEGVEERAQADFLQEEGCRVAQGFHFGPPLPPDELLELLRRRELLPIRRRGGG